MEFLVNIKINWPPDGDPDEKERLFRAEVARGAELAREGLMKRLWRVPGRWENWALYEASDASAVHDAVTSLPLWPWMQVTVHPLADNPFDPPRRRDL